MPIIIFTDERVVAAVAVQVPALRVFRMLIGKRCVRAGEPPLRPGEVPGPEEIEAILAPRITSFFAGTTGSDAGIVFGARENVPSSARLK
jgi:hypothetical protein